MSVIDPAMDEDAWLAAMSAQPLTRQPVEVAHVMLVRTGPHVEQMIWDYRGDHSAADGDVFTVLCDQCAEAHAIVLRSASRWYAVPVDEWVAEDSET